MEVDLKMCPLTVDYTFNITEFPCKTLETVFYEESQNQTLDK